MGQRATFVQESNSITVIPTGARIAVARVTIPQPADSLKNREWAEHEARNQALMEWFKEWGRDVPWTKAQAHVGHMDFEVVYELVVTA
jgi:hypothetical protein